MQGTGITPWSTRGIALALAVVSLATAACGDYSSTSSAYPGDSTYTTPRVVAAVTVTPAERTLIAGDSLTLLAKAIDAAEAPIEGRPVTWESSDNAVATVDAYGGVKAISPGAVTIRATVDGKTGTATLTITRPSVATVELSPATLTLGQGDSATLQVRALDANGYELSGVAATWVSRDPSIVEVNATGRVLGKKAGTAVVSVSIENHVAEATVTVSATSVAPVASIAVTPVALLLDLGQTRQLTAIVLDVNGNRLTDRVVTWSSDTPSVVQVSSTGLITATGLGYATITATCEGKTFSLAVTVSYQ